MTSRLNNEGTEYVQSDPGKDFTELLKRHPDAAQAPPASVPGVERG